MLGETGKSMDIKTSDIMVSLGKAGAGFIPVMGPIVGEIIGNLIPNQRIDRIASLLKALESKIDDNEKAKIEKRMLDEKSVDLMEDGFLQATRALSEERIAYIASLLKKSLTAEDLEHIAYKKLLSLLGELNDLEVLILKSYSVSLADRDKFRQKHRGVLASPPAYFGATQELVDKRAIHETHKAQLVRLGLLKIQFKKPKRGEPPEFDENTGMVKASGHAITFLGSLLLRSIDQDENTPSKER